MNLVLKGADDPPFELGKDFGVMVSFDDDVTAKKANEVLVLLEQYLKNQQGRLFHQWWNIDVLAFTSMGELAALEAAMADMIIIAIHDGQQLPEAVATWMRRFLDRRDDRPGALMALLDSDPNRMDLSQGLLSQLRQAAELGHLDFFAARVSAGRNEGASRVAIEAAAQFVLACKSRAQRTASRSPNAPQETIGA